MGEFAVGQSVPREEDPRLLTGGGEFLDDINLRDQAWAYVLRSPHAMANILSIDTAAAEAAPGVLRVLTGKDWDKENYGGLPCEDANKKKKGYSYPKSSIYYHIYFSLFFFIISSTTAVTLLLFTSVLIIFFINSADVSEAILLIFDKEVFFKSLISFSTEDISFSI